MRTNDAGIGHSNLGVTTKLLAGVCHNCGICPFAARRPDSTFGRIMRWHRTWCPAWNAHTIVYGEKPLAEPSLVTNSASTQMVGFSDEWPAIAGHFSKEEFRPPLGCFGRKSVSERSGLG